KVLDVRDTLLRTLPREISRLPMLFTVDVRGAPLETKMQGFEANTAGLLSYLQYKDRRRALKTELQQKLRLSLYREVAGTPLGHEVLPPLAKAACRRFRGVNDLKQLVRHCDRLFPADLAACGGGNGSAEADRMHARFVALQRQNERKMLSAELELKIRAIYYDRIDDLTAVEGYIRDVYAAVPLLEDVQFLIQHAPKLFPAEARDISGPAVAAAMAALQRQLTAARAACIAALGAALAALYGERGPRVEALADGVAAHFAHGRFANEKELECLRKLTADAAGIFPADLAGIDPAAVAAVF
ncbi:unnamed protein product, partial [Phaeothamnion confervicola]